MAKSDSKLTRRDLYSDVATQCHSTLAEASRYVDACFNAIITGVADGKKVEIRRFGTFYVKNRPEKEIFNPAKRVKQVVKARKVPVFKTGTSFVEKLNSGGRESTAAE